VNATLDTDVLEKEKMSFCPQLTRCVSAEDSPRRRLGLQLYAQLFEGHPYGRRVIARPSWCGITRDTLADSNRRHYVPETFAVVAVAPWTRSRCWRRRARRSAGCRAGRAAACPLHRRPISAAASGADASGAHAHLGMAWPATRLDHADTPALDLLVSILGRSRSSRLVQAPARARWARRLRRRIVLGAGGRRGVTVSAELPPGNVDRAEAGVLAEIRRIRAAGVTEAELRRAITPRSEHEFETETAEGRARALDARRRSGRSRTSSPT